MSLFRYLSHYHPNRFDEKDIPVFQDTCGSLSADSHKKISKSSSVYEATPNITTKDKWIRNTVLAGLVYSAISISDYFLEARPIHSK